MKKQLIKFTVLATFLLFLFSSTHKTATSVYASEFDIQYVSRGWNKFKERLIPAIAWPFCSTFSSKINQFWKTAPTTTYFEWNIPYGKCREEWKTPNTPRSPSPSFSVAKNIHPYPAYGVNPSLSLNKIKIISLIFIPKDVSIQPKTEWYSNMEYIDNKIKEFFQREFQNNVGVSSTIVSTPITGIKNIGEYTSYDIALEVLQNTSQLSDSNLYNTRLIYLVRDLANNKNLNGNMGSYPTIAISLQGEFWLDNNAVRTETNAYGLMGSAHEFAHLLGIPHPWELPANTLHDPNYGNVPGDLMSYSNNDVRFDNLYLRDDVKSAMGL